MMEGEQEEKEEEEKEEQEEEKQKQDFSTQMLNQYCYTAARPGKQHKGS